ncbi:hypothetical protein LTS10_012069 [Elasticomyces elasticus]|nr:hypothetical protein LTS10_012069 [Elasticomyces elasticus]
MSSSTTAFSPAASVEVEDNNIGHLPEEHLTANQPMAAREASMAQREEAMVQREASNAIREAKQDNRQTEQDQREASLRRSKDDVDSSYRAYQLHIQKSERKLLSRERVPNEAFRFVDMEGKRLKAKQKVFKAFEENEEAFQEKCETFDEKENERKRRSFYSVFSKKTGLSVVEIEAMNKEGPLRMVVEYHLPAVQEIVESGEANDEFDLLPSGHGGMC